MAFQKAFISFALVVCLICPVCVSQLLDGCDNRPKDIVFILDASSSIWPVDFHTQLKFLQNLTKTFNIGPSDIQTRVGIVTFSNSWKVEFHLNEKMNKPDLAKAIRRVRHLTGGTNTADAINFVADNMFLPENGARHDSTKIVIVITDGESYYKDKTAAASKKLREKDVSVFAIGVGSNIDLKELESIASDPSDKYVLEVLNYRGLKRIESILRQRTCEVTMAPTVATSPSTTRTTLKPSTTTTQTTVTTTELPTTKEPSTQRPEIAKTTPDAENLQADRGKITKNCGGKPADVFFLLDTSGSIHPTDFKKQLDFVGTVVGMFDISPDKTRVGLSTFSHEYNRMFGLEQYHDKDSLLGAIKSVPYSGGGTDTGHALKQLREREFSRQFTRPSVAHIIIVLTDGLSRFPDQTKTQAAMIKKTGSYVFAVGIGDNIDKNELSNIASSPDSNINKYAFQVTNFDGLRTLRNILAIKTCEIASFQRDEKVCRTNKTSDIMFVFDSAYYGYKMSNIILDLIQQVSMYLATTGGKIKTGIQSNSCLKDSIRQLSADPIEVVQDYDALPQLITDLRIKQFMSANGGRGTSTKMAVVFVDNTLSKTAKLQVLRSKFRKINFIFVQIGNEVMDKKLQKLAGKAHYVVALQSDSHTTAQHLNTLLCEGI
ncbi:collagen alpha-1(XII) chain-like isoform X1 [Mytilus californianus]|uniref:collagen alpha-1(XII) chain-like isoform X1 n=1 Tax=Mytilus californianus TaxID=6549 RepID=UPI00224737AA|nr:collagen alpha-1(XII) chain-like isoform X1 [Mytilus californianus]